MNRFLSSIVLFLITGSTVCILAQPLREPTFEMKLIKAEELAMYGDYYNALDLYQELYKENKDVFLVRPIAVTSMKLRDYERAERWLEKMVTRPDRFETNLQDTLLYAEVLKYSGKSEQARMYYEDFIDRTSVDSMAAYAELQLKGLDLLDQLEESKEIFAEPVAENVNYGLTEASPALDADGNLYFSSFKKRSKITIDKDADNFHFKIYKSKKESDSWSKPEKLSKKINREDYHTANVAFSKDGRMMYFTRARLEGDSLATSKIYYSVMGDDGWKGPKEIPSVNGDWIATHPTYGELYGDEVLLFASDMDGSYGGFDLYYAEVRGDGTFGPPINMGDVLNTPGDEITPRYDQGTIYFATDGRPSIGGLDIYKATWDGTQWSKPKHMGLPFNSTYDDFYLDWDDEAKKGYMVSNRPYPSKKSSKSESCCDDIFEVAEQDIAINTLVKVFDADRKPLPGATVSIKQILRGESQFVDKKTSEKGNTFDMPLKVDRAYWVVISKPGYHPDSFKVNTVGLLEPNTFDRQIFLEVAPPLDDGGDGGDSVQIITINEPIRLNRIYYDLDDDKILPEAEPDLRIIEGLMKEHRDMVIELSSHTDARGNDDHNEDLSQRRAESAKSWLIKRGISPARIKAKGYGEREILNQCKNGVRCTETEHRFNRRTEFKIIAGPKTIEIKKEVRDAPGQGYVPSSDIRIQTGASSLAWMTGRVVAYMTTEAKLSLKYQFHDFGIVEQGQQKRHAFDFTNTGDKFLVIDRVTAPAHVSVSYPDYVILPGQSGMIELSYDSKSVSGEDEVALDVITNTAQEVHNLRVRAFVQP